MVYKGLVSFFCPQLFIFLHISSALVVWFKQETKLSRCSVKGCFPVKDCTETCGTDSCVKMYMLGDFFQISNSLCLAFM